MITIHAQKHNITEIDIFGDIGEDFFAQLCGEEENSIKSIKERLDEISGDILVNISSLGGNAFEGMGIHDLLKTYDRGTVTTRMIGATASAGTFIALAGSPVQISENALFLIHNSHTVAVGNADDMRETADMLDKFDSLQTTLYSKKTKKKADEINSLMAEEKWITAIEAKEMGFVDEIIVPMAIAAKYDNKKIKAAGFPELPTKFIENIQPKMENNESSLKASILALVGFKNDEVIKAENTALKAEVAELKAKAPEAVDTTVFTTEIENLKSEIQAKADYDIIKAELETTKSDLAKAKAGTLQIGASADPTPTGEPKELNEGQKILTDMLKNADPTILAMYSNKN